MKKIETVDAVCDAMRAAGIGWRGDRLTGLALTTIDAVRGSIDPDGSDEILKLRCRVKTLESAIDPFARAWRVMEAVPAQYRSAIEDSDGARDHLPGAWPTVGDLRRASEALK